LLSVAGLAALLGACTTCGAGVFEEPRAHALRIATENGVDTARVEAGVFTLYTAYKGGRGDSDRIVVYVEGDGRAWPNRFVPSADPTPLDPIGLELAVRDPAPLVVYLARPCQYTVSRSVAGCHPRYWATHRYAPEVIDSIGRAIDHYKTVLGAREVELVGYSGGGAVAALVAAHRDDVVSLTTVAATVDHAAWTAHHDLTPLRGSLNPADFAARLQGVPQIHLVGEDDWVVPGLVTRAFLARMIDRSRARLVVIEDFGHRCYWVRDWPALRRRYAPF
jgi:pimeloyl-ACP methyl ester carboxylesterase